MQALRGRSRVYTEFLNPENQDVILSIGCKNGYFESNIRGMVKAMHAIDIDAVEIEKNRRKEPRIMFGCCDITKGTDFPDGHFDKVIFNEVIEHLPHGTELNALKEINRILKKGGTLLLSTPNDNPLSKLSDPEWWVKGHRHYKKERIAQLLEKSGFKVEREFVGGGYLQSLAMPFFYLLCILRIYGEGSLERLVDHEYRNGRGFWTLIVKARKISTV